MLALREDDEAGRGRGGIRPEHLPPFPPLLQLYGLDRKEAASAKALKQAMEDLWGYACDAAAAYALFESSLSQTMAASLQRPSRLIAARACAFSVRNFRKMLSDITYLAGEIAAWDNKLDRRILASLEERLAAHCLSALAAFEPPPARGRPSRTKYKVRVLSRLEASSDWPNA